MNGLIERIVENWLTNTNERGYEIPFAQCLINDGHNVLLTPSHGPFEQGKDIVSIDSNGDLYAYQLKTGQIDLTEWRKIYGEIVELVEIPIKYPSYNSKKHRPYLVTNFGVSDPVRVNIIDRNREWVDRGFLPLELITKEQLLRIFINNHGDFLPVQIEDFQLFLELLLVKDRSELNKDKFIEFIDLFIKKDFSTNTEMKRTLTSLVLLCQYILGQYELNNIHLPIIEGWMTFLNYLFYMVEKNKLPEEYWFNTFKIVMDKINYQICEMKKELFTRENYLEKGWDGGLFLKARLTIIGGWISASELVNSNIEKDYKLDKTVYDFIKSQYNNMWYWGESSTPFFIIMSKFLEQYGDIILSNEIINNTLSYLVINNNKEECKGMPDPYWSPTKVLEDEYGVADEVFKRKSFIGLSYHLSALVHLLIKRDKRSTLTAIWSELTYLMNCRIIPNKMEDYLLYRIEDGNYVSYFYKNPQSWKELSDEAQNKIADYIPKLLIKYPYYVYYMLLNFPHRLDQEIVKLI